MKRLFIAALLALSSIAFGATLNPVQLLNPTGSTAGQTIVSTGASSAPAWGGVPVNGIAAIAANSVIGNATNASASPTAVTVTGCNGAAQALQWTNGSGFGCNSSVATSGANTNITSLSSPTITTPNIVGTSTNNNANAGSVGEYPAPTNLTNVSMTSGATTTCASIALTAGDWDVSGVVTFTPTGQLTQLISSTSATTSQDTSFRQLLILTFSNGAPQQLVSPENRISLSSSGTAFVLGAATFSTGTTTCSGFIRARRVR